ncbi:MAG: helix-hairpin-helix domain-containing protein, partial [Polyangiaceae bacterium]|nr:helix-hairpin-helix domain-containing protein [Polyangiaceae bacterium]
FSLLPKAAFGLLALAALGLLGSGALDDYVPTKSALAPAEAAPAVRASARATASASASALPSGSASVSAVPSASASAAPRALVVLNSATESDLTKLPGVGPKKAQAILKLREKLGGRFKRIDDLTRVRGLKRKALEKIRPLVVLDAEDDAKKRDPPQ